MPADPTPPSPTPPDPQPQPQPTPTPVARYESCAEVLANVPGTADGEQQLFVAGNALKPWTAWCVDMQTGSPKEYLTLPMTGPTANVSSYASNSFTGGSNVVTQYAKLRIDPTSLMVDVDDQRFATSTGSLYDHGVQALTVTSMPYGYAASMDDTVTATANIELHGTPFVYDGQFVWIERGSFAASADHQTFDLSGGGFPQEVKGWISPPGYSQNPGNANGGGFILQLAYVH
jgi:hypothetical protein